MKKLLLVLLAVILCMSSFACGETYTEVAEEDYVETMTEFVGEEAELTAGELTNNFRVYVKMVDGSEWMSTECISKGTGDELQMLAEVKTKEGEADVQTIVATYVKDKKIYTQIENPLGDGVVKVSYDANPTLIAMYTTGVTGVNGAIELLTSTISLDPADTEFIASIGKMEISGNKGGDRKLRLTITEGEQGTASYATGTVTLAFDKDNKVVGINMSFSMTTTEDGTSEVVSVELVVENYTGNISFPSFADYTA